MSIPKKEVEAFPSNDPLDDFEHIVNEAVHKRVGRKRLYQVLVSHGYTGTEHHAYYVVLKRRREIKGANLQKQNNGNGASSVASANLTNQTESIRHENTQATMPNLAVEMCGSGSTELFKPEATALENKISSDDVAEGILNRVISIGTKGLHNG